MTTAHPLVDASGRPTIQRQVSSPLPAPRGPVSEYVLRLLRHAPDTAVPASAPELTTPPDPLGEDAQLALYVLYELHYRGFAGVDERWEWDPLLLHVRSTLEQPFEAAVRDAVGDVPAPDDIVAWLGEQMVHEPNPETSVAGWCRSRGELVHLREQAVLRSPYQLKEADPHSWALPRLTGRAKAALVTIQHDEYGEGSVADQHAELFALHLDRIGLDASYGAYLDVVPAWMLATVNLVSMFGLHRRLRGALVGHLTCFEMASVPVMTDLGEATRRLGFDAWTTLFYDVHVVADAQHQRIAAVDLAGGLVEEHPELLGDVVFGVLALGALEARATAATLDAWRAGDSALLRPLPEELAAPGRTQRYDPTHDPRESRIDEVQAR